MQDKGGPLQEKRPIWKSLAREKTVLQEIRLYQAGHARREARHASRAGVEGPIGECLAGIRLPPSATCKRRLIGEFVEVGH